MSRQIPVLGPLASEGRPAVCSAVSSKAHRGLDVPAAPHPLSVVLSEGCRNKHHKLVPRNNRHGYSPIWRPEVWAGPGSPCRRSASLLSQLLVVAGHLWRSVSWLKAVSTPFSASCASVLPRGLLPRVFLSLSRDLLRRVPVVGCRAHPDPA